MKQCDSYRKEFRDISYVRVLLKYICKYWYWLKSVKNKTLRFKTYTPLCDWSLSCRHCYLCVRTEPANFVLCKLWNEAKDRTDGLNISPLTSDASKISCPLRDKCRKHDDFSYEISTRNKVEPERPEKQLTI